MRRQQLPSAVLGLAVRVGRLQRRVAAVEARVAELERQRPRIVRTARGMARPAGQERQIEARRA